MSLSETYFGKELNRLEYADVVAFFVTTQEESDKLEFKSFPSNGNVEGEYEKIYKSASAFLNTEGGILIWGAPQGQNNNGRKTFQGALKPINEILEKDSVIRKVSDKLTPLPNAIRVKILEHDSTCVCVFEMDKSNYAPHQYNGVYYMRLDGQTRFAPHHYVEALIKQERHPNIEGYIRFNNIDFDSDKKNLLLPIQIFIFNWSPLQNEYDISFKLVTTEGSFQRYHQLGSGEQYWIPGQVMKKNWVNILHYGSPQQESETIILDINNLYQNNYEFEIVLVFSGKKSPAKASKYKLKINPEQFNPIGILEKEENISMYEKQMRIGISKEEQLRKIIGRE